MNIRTASISLNILKLFSGKIATQVLSFITVPIITRLFLPHHFGVVQLFDSIAIVITMITSLKYEFSIPLARNDKEALASLALSALITLCVTLLVTIVVVMGRAYLASWFNAPELGVFLWFLPLVVFINGFGNALVHWAAREERFGAIALSDLGQFLPERLIQIVWGMFIGASTSGLFVARLIGVGARIGMLFTLLSRKLIIDLNTIKLSLEKLWSVAKRHKKFPLFTTGTWLLSIVSEQLIPFFFSAYFSTTLVGYYSLGYRAIRLPVTMLSTSIQKVFFPAAAREYREFGSLSNIVSKFFIRLVQIGVFPMAIVSFFGPLLFEIVYGLQWSMAGVYAQIFVVWYFMVFINSPLRVPEIVNRQEISLMITILTATGRTIALLIGVTTASPIKTIGIFVTVSVCCAFGNLVWQLKLAHVSVWWALKILMQYIAISCILLFPVGVLSWITDDFRFTLGMLGFATLLYGIILLKIDDSLRQFIKERTQQFIIFKTYSNSK